MGLLPDSPPGQRHAVGVLVHLRIFDRKTLAVGQTTNRPQRANALFQGVSRYPRVRLERVYGRNRAIIRRCTRTGRPHMSLGPGLPDPPTHSVTPFPTSPHRVGAPLRVGVKSVLGGLHHENALLAATT